MRLQLALVSGIVLHLPCGLELFGKKPQKPPVHLVRLGKSGNVVGIRNQLNFHLGINSFAARRAVWGL